MIPLAALMIRRANLAAFRKATKYGDPELRLPHNVNRARVSLITQDTVSPGRNGKKNGKA